MSLIPVSRPPAVPEPLVIDTTHVSDALMWRLETVLKHYDRVGVGNVYLDVLFEPRMESRPNPDCLFLWAALPFVLGHLLDMPAELLAAEAYPKPYLDAHVDYRDRPSWQKGIFIHLVSVAYGLGATRTNLPPPHGALVRYYRDTGAQCMQCLLAYSQEYDRVRQLVAERETATRALPPPQIGAHAIPDIAQKIADNARAGIPPEATARAIIARLQQGAPPDAGPPRTQAGFRSL